MLERGSRIEIRLGGLGSFEEIAMIEGARTDARKTKKIDRGGVRTSNSSQSTARTASNINHQTFPKLRNSILKITGKIMLKMGLNRSIFCRILPAFAAVLRLLKRKPDLSALLSRNFSSTTNRLCLRHSDGGYILIMMVALIPLLLFGTKYVMDYRTAQEAELNNGKAIDYNQLAKDLALTIARNWNPGLTLSKQINALYKVADEKYNRITTYGLLSQAIPSMDVQQIKKSNKQGGKYAPLKMDRVEATVKKIVNYSESKKYETRYGFSNSSWNPYYVMWQTVDERTDPSVRVSEFDEKDGSGGEYVLEHQNIFGTPMVNPNSALFIITTPNKANNHATYLNSMSYTGTETLITTDERSYQSRGSTSYLGVSITSDDKIKVSVGGKEGFATPAKCNVDIVLAVPVNGAASNKDNQDDASDTVGSPQSEESSDGKTLPDNIKKTPLYQMGQACKNFVKDNFYYTHGVTMSLIPYSGKFSLAPIRSDWTYTIPQFNGTPTHTSSTANTQSIMVSSPPIISPNNSS